MSIAQSRPTKGAARRSCVYAIRHVESGRAYVGSTADLSKRWSEHRNRLLRQTHPSPHLLHAWLKYGAESFEWVVLEDAPVEQLLAREQYWCDLLRSYERGYGFNIRREASSNLGVRLRAETKQAMRAAHLGRSQSREHAKNQCAARSGVKRTQEQRLVMSHARRIHPIALGEAIIALTRADVRPAEIIRISGASPGYVYRIRGGRAGWLKR